jgi:hypothetical protein
MGKYNMNVEIIKRNFGKEFAYLRLYNQSGETIIRIDEKKYDDISYLLDNEINYVGKQSKIQNNKRIHRL